MVQNQISGNISQTRPTTKREVSLDVLRGLAVLSMVITHAIAFLYKGTDPFIANLGLVGGIISFTLFLFISGAAQYLSFVRYSSHEQETIARRRKQLLYRTVGMLIGYYVVATVASIPSYSFPPNLGWVENIARTLFLSNVPEFAEFILAFVLFSLMALAFRRVYAFLLKFPPLLIAVGVALFILGQVLNPVDLGPTATFIKSLLVGQGDWHRFPIFQYFIVYALGLIWGKFLFNHASLRIRLRINLYSLLAVVIALVAVQVSYGYLGFTWLDPLFRWPPSVGFILAGLVAVYGGTLLLNATGQLRILGFGQVMIHYFGSSAFNLFVFHTIVLFVYKYISGDNRTDSSILLLAMFILLMAISSLLSVVKDWLIDNLKEEAGVSEGFGWMFSERVLVAGIWIAVIFLGGLGIYQGNRVSAEVNPEQVLFKKRLLREQDWPFWWDHNYNYFHQITISAAGTPHLRNNWFSINFNHGAAVAAGQSQASGADLRIVFFDDQNGFIELPIIAEGIGGEANIKFKLQQDVWPDQTDDRYFLYYGNSESPSYPVSKETPSTAISNGITLSEVFKHHVSGSANRRWVIKEGGLASQKHALLYTVQLDSTISPDSLVSYSVSGTNVRGLMDDLGGGKFQAAIKVSDLPPGAYKVQALAREKENKLKLIESGFTTFLVSYPLYVVWTLDWEGWDVPDAWMAEIDAFARRYDMPMTHFFNPRIFIAANSPYLAVSRQRADAMALWVLNRASKFKDEIGLHLHMWYDMVAAAGVTPRGTDYAGWLYPNGGGAAAYTYPKDEMKKILMWSRRMFQDNGLPPPKSFRAGGWLAKENTLQALEETGFMIDSSGRTQGGTDGPTASMATLPPPWNLSPTTRPYKPNVNNVNSSDAPQMNIWEFPNNGADSIWYNEVEMIRRFDLNYPAKGQILTEPQVVNYLSHPPFWNIDKPRVEALFAYISRFLYRNDAGPVVFSTLESVYAQWDRS